LYWPEIFFLLLVEQPRPDQQQFFLEMAVSAYLTARQEVSILRSIRHDHIVPLLGLSARQPLALVLSLAPKGSLRNELDLRKKNKQRLSVFIIKQIVIQVWIIHFTDWIFLNTGNKFVLNVLLCSYHVDVSVCLDYDLSFPPEHWYMIL
jgi:hypothetical protein